MTRARAASGLTTAQIEAALAARYAPPEHALLFNVKNGTGYGRTERFADAIAMNLYPSRGLEVLGFEIKVSRTDWIRERKDPAKAEVIAAFCDRWWLAVGDSAIVQPGELPPTWGLLGPKGNGLSVEVDAPKLDAQPLDRRFIAAMLRRACEQSPEAVREAEQRGYERGHKKSDEHYEARVKMLERYREEAGAALGELRREVQQFETAAGFAITGYRKNARIGEVVRLALAGSFTRDLKEYRDNLARLVAAADESLAALAAGPIERTPDA